MEIDKSTISYLAHLSRLNFNEKDEAKMRQDLGKILDWVKELDEVDTEGVEPLYHMTENINSVREDQANNSIDRESALKNAPKQDGTFFRVPKVVE